MKQGLTHFYNVTYFPRGLSPLFFVWAAGIPILQCQFIKSTSFLFIPFWLRIIWTHFPSYRHPLKRPPATNCIPGFKQMTLIQGSRAVFSPRATFPSRQPSGGHNPVVGGVKTQSGRSHACAFSNFPFILHFLLGYGTVAFWYLHVMLNFIHTSGHVMQPCICHHPLCSCVLLFSPLFAHGTSGKVCQNITPNSVAQKWALHFR